MWAAGYRVRTSSNYTKPSLTRPYVASQSNSHFGEWVQSYERSTMSVKNIQSFSLKWWRNAKFVENTIPPRIARPIKPNMWEGGFKFWALKCRQNKRLLCTRLVLILLSVKSKLDKHSMNLNSLSKSNTYTIDAVFLWESKKVQKRTWLNSHLSQQKSITKEHFNVAQ